jgi:hypothetical protein
MKAAPSSTPWAQSLAGSNEVLLDADSRASRRDVVGRQ